MINSDFFYFFRYSSFCALFNWYLHSNQVILCVIEPFPTVEEAISEPSEYEVMRTTAIAKQNHAIQIKLEKVISYMNEESLNRLCVYVAEYSSGDIFCKVSPVKIDSQLKN